MPSRKWMWIAAAIGVTLVVWVCSSSYDGQPKFFPATRRITVSPSNTVTYPFLTSRMIQNDRMWIHLFGPGQNNGTYLLDLKNRKIVGELRYGGPCFFDEFGEKLVCIKRESRGWMTSKWGRPIAVLLTRLIRSPKYNLNDEPETIWLLDIRNNKAKRIGVVEEARGQTGQVVPSPDLKRAFVHSMSTSQRNELAICDLTTKDTRQVPFNAWPCEWWNNQTILARKPNHEFVLFDVVSNSFRLLIDSNTITPWLQHAPLAPGTGAPGIGAVKWPADVSPFAVWNGKENDFYVTDHLRRWGATNSFLLKIDRPSGKLTTISTNFSFGWGDQFSADGSYYIYSSTNSQSDNSGVFVRELTNDTARALVPPIAVKPYSIPRFYRDGVIFMRSNAVHFIKLNETNSVQLFP